MPRRSERRVALLLASAFLSFASLTLFSSSDADFVTRVNDISEICCLLTFLIQITIIGRDVTRKVKIPSLCWMTHIAELFIVAGFCAIFVNIVADLASLVDVATLDMLDNIVENLSLVFIAFFRFYYMALSQGGFREMAQNHKLEIAAYALLITHEYPFMALNRFTGVSWEFVQAIYMRVLIVACMAITIRDKLRGSSRGKKYEASSSVSKDRRGSANSGTATTGKSVVIVRNDRRSSIVRPNTIHVVTPVIDAVAPHDW